MPRRRCLDAGASDCLTFTRSGSRCTPCEKRRKSRRNADAPAAADLVAAATECADCGQLKGNPKNPLVADHKIIPFRDGGELVEGNAQVLCRRCNRKKG